VGVAVLEITEPSRSGYGDLAGNLLIRTARVCFCFSVSFGNVNWGEGDVLNLDSSAPLVLFPVAQKHPRAGMREEEGNANETNCIEP
jgi:hypothetical protein